MPVSNRPRRKNQTKQKHNVPVKKLTGYLVVDSTIKEVDSTLAKVAGISSTVPLLTQYFTPEEHQTVQTSLGQLRDALVDKVDDKGELLQPGLPRAGVLLKEQLLALTARKHLKEENFLDIIALAEDTIIRLHQSIVGPLAELTLVLERYSDILAEPVVEKDSENV